MSDLVFSRSTDAAEAAADAARHIAACAVERLRKQRVFTLALSGGSTPGLMLEVLAGLDLPWSRIHVFQVDERIAGAGDPARNINMVRNTLLRPGLLAPDNLHPMPVESADPAAAAADYAHVLSQITGTPPRLDLVHLGLGDDGHTASLVPGDAALDVRDSAVTVTAPYRGHRRMTPRRACGWPPVPARHSC